jgi:hypothetical protein
MILSRKNVTPSRSAESLISEIGHVNAARLIASDRPPSNDGGLEKPKG